MKKTVLTVLCAFTLFTAGITRTESEAKTFERAASLLKAELDKPFSLEERAEETITVTLDGRAPVILNPPSGATRTLFRIVRWRELPEDAAFLADIDRLLADGADAQWVDEEGKNILHHLASDAILSVPRHLRSPFPFLQTLQKLLDAGANIDTGYLYHYQGRSCSFASSRGPIIDALSFWKEEFPDAYELVRAHIAKTN